MTAETAATAATPGGMFDNPVTPNNPKKGVDSDEASQWKLMDKDEFRKKYNVHDYLFLMKDYFQFCS